MDARRFDGLTKALAEGTSRRRLLGGLAATVLATLGRRGVAAQTPCGDACAGLSGRQKDHCVRVCKRCNKASLFLCQDPRTGAFSCCDCPPERVCFGPSGETCCPEGTFCDFETGECPALVFCEPDVPADNCFAGVFSECGTPEDDCGLVENVDGGCSCIERFCSEIGCASGADCDSGLCVNVPGCCSTVPFCAIPCGDPVPDAASTGGWR